MVQPSMQVPQGVAQAEINVSRSRFLAILLPVRSADEARGVLKDLKARYDDASHVVHAFLVGPVASRITGSSDDGEPPGTAGRPVMDILGGSGGSNAMIVIARWFGGTKLGTGGLVRAYGDAARAVLAVTTWKTLRDLVTVTISSGYDHHRELRDLLNEVGAEHLDESFGSEILMSARVPREAVEGLQSRTRDLSRGQLAWSVDLGRERGSSTGSF